MLEIRDFLGVPEPLKINCAKPATTPIGVATAEKQINVEYLNSLKANLAKNANAMAYLKGEKRGLESDTITYFGLGLSKSYKGSDGVVQKDALVAPMRSPDTGKFINKTAYICIPVVTQNPISCNGWMKPSVPT